MDRADRDRCPDALAVGPRQAVVNRLEALAALDRTARADALKGMIASLRPAPPEGAPAPPRALALLAARVPEPVGKRWLSLAPPPRPGFIASGGLREHLRRLIVTSLDGAGRSERETAELEGSPWPA
jgi:hypothetical protein